MGALSGIKSRVQLHQGTTDIPPDRWQNRDLVPLPPSKFNPDDLVGSREQYSYADRQLLTNIQVVASGRILTLSAYGQQCS
jgi:hypothetical protein